MGMPKTISKSRQNKMLFIMATKTEKDVSKYASRRYEFQSQFLRGGNVILPETIIIENGIVTWSRRKAYIFGHDVKSMTIGDISQMDISIGLISTNFTLFSKSKTKIEAHNFSKGDALFIKKIIGK
jgi:hypothetical protein